MGHKTNFGEIIDLLIRASKKLPEEKQRYTRYIEDTVAKEADLSSRQINRMRDYDDEFPEEKALRKLAAFLPELEIINPVDICSRLTLPWGNIEIDQENLPIESTITIFAGWEKPVGISNPDIAKSIAINIDKKQFEYAFIFPSLDTFATKGDNKKELEAKAKSQIKEWVELLRAKVSMMWYSNKIGDLDAATGIENVNLADFQEKLKTHIKAYYSTGCTNIWLLLPSPYSVFYNLAKNNKQNTSKYGMFRIEGILLSSGERNIITDGWLLTNEEQYSRLDKSFDPDSLNEIF